jgi:hypothetical protein
MSKEIRTTHPKDTTNPRYETKRTRFWVPMTEYRYKVREAHMLNAAITNDGKIVDPSMPN